MPSGDSGNEAMLVPLPKTVGKGKPHGAT